jgi:hypothetical protein
VNDRNDVNTQLDSRRMEPVNKEVRASELAYVFRSTTSANPKVRALAAQVLASHSSEFSPFSGRRWAMIPYPVERGTRVNDPARGCFSRPRWYIVQIVSSDLFINSMETQGFSIPEFSDVQRLTKKSV